MNLLKKILTGSRYLIIISVLGTLLGSIIVLGYGAVTVVGVLITNFFLGWQTRLEQDLLQSREIGSGILAKAELLATSLPPRGELLTHRVPRLRILKDNARGKKH